MQHGAHSAEETVETRDVTQGFDQHLVRDAWFVHAFRLEAPRWSQQIHALHRAFHGLGAALLPALSSKLASVSASRETFCPPSTVPVDTDSPRSASSRLVS